MEAIGVEVAFGVCCSRLKHLDTLFTINFDDDIFGAINFGDNIFGGINFGEISTIHRISIEIRSLKIFGWAPLHRNYLN